MNKVIKIFLVIVIGIAIGVVAYKAIFHLQIKSVEKRLISLFDRYTVDYTIDSLTKEDKYFLAKVKLDDVAFIDIWTDTGEIFDTFGLVWKAPIKNVLVKFEVATVPKVCIILDDAGYKFHPEVDWAMQIRELNPTISVLPKVQYSRRLNEFLRKNGFVTMLHLPLQPHSWPRLNPGPGLILIKDDESRIIRKFEEDLASVGTVDAVNNHEGSLFTENKEKMRILLGHIYQRGLFFIDSRTTKYTVIPEIAEQDGYIFLQKDMFIDNKRDIEYVLKMLEQLIDRAKKKGYAIGIGHLPRRPTIAALKQLLSKKRDVKFVNIKQLYELKYLGLLK